MKLKKIAVSGFKSFVDQTNVSFNSQIVGVVGPNGCGKSNVIDAVRWVMGESSAKMLRGESMEDVIFNGSSTRKPVGRASVELIFDNSLGRIKSHYKDFAEIIVGRVLSRDGKSEYRINNKRVRRKDVLDIFRGTGLGPRSYSIIEQGMVSRIVEAKPEELRAYVEEAAGISRYKDRRRETENRIRHTRENIERSEDIRGELLAQLRRLKRQAQTAERYKKLQQKRRDKTAILYRLRFDVYAEQITSAQQTLDQSSNKLEKKRADQREIEAAIEAQRSAQGQAQDKLSDIQAQFYQAGADISKFEQKIEHIKVTEEQDAKALTEVNDALAQITTQVQTDEAMLIQYQKELADLSPGLITDESKLDKAQQAYEQAREAFNEWQQQFTQHRQQVQSKANEKQLQLSIIDQINRQQNRAQDRHQQLEAERARLQAELEGTKSAAHAERLKALQADFDQLQMQNEQAQEQMQASAEKTAWLNNQLNEQGALKSTTESRIHSLEEFQTAALSNRHKDYRQWLSAANLDDSPRLASQLKIDKGWERAADRILAPYLNSRVDASGKHDFWLKPAEHAVTLISIDQQKH
ncbi:MAG: AAA family ATPase, partial [Methylococcales bacterium]|nr:AAA family ATPase [Methylococcales bacterium]